MQGWTEDTIKKLVYTSKQLNTIPERTLPLYNIALIGDLSSLEPMKAALKKCYDEISVATSTTINRPTAVSFIS